MPASPGAARSTMADPGRSAGQAVAAARRTWRRLNGEQRAAAVGAILLIVSTFGPFSFVEAALVLIGVGVLVLLKQRADGKLFHLPFGDGTVIMAAGVWSALLIVVRLFDRPLGQNLLALACTAVLVAAGIAERQRRPADDLPFSEEEAFAGLRRSQERGKRPAGDAPAPGGAEVPAPDAPPEFRRPGEASEQLALPETEDGPDAPTRSLPGREPAAEDS
jgi:hypothetical protein